MRFRVRGILMPSRQDVIVKVEADNVYDAATIAGKQIRESGQLTMGLISALSVKPMKSSKSAVYIGQPRTKKAGRPGGVPRKAAAAPTNGTEPTATDAPSAASEAPAATEVASVAVTTEPLAVEVPAPVRKRR